MFHLPVSRSWCVAATVSAFAAGTLNERSSIDASATHGFKVTRTNGYGVAVSHSQTNTQLMYAFWF
ncbi:MAG: hypothetical protein Q7S40_16975 [Opitutaceae bacterium]|nr:hypothetical protein [Opitutaceae bacterium]